MSLRTRTRLALTLLVLAHLLGLPLCPYFYSALGPPSPTPIALWAMLGLASGQASLVGLWAALGGVALRYRLACSALGGAYLCALGLTAAHRLGLGLVNFTVLWFLVPLAAVAGIGGWLRHHGSHVELFTGPAPPSTNESLQFRLWHLLTVTFVVTFVVAGLLTLLAVLLTLASELREYHYHWAAGAAVFLLAGTMVAIIFSAQTLATLWATLGLGRWLPRLLLLYFFTVAGANIMSYSLGVKSLHVPLEPVFCLNFCQFYLVAASLLVLRALGYRLVRERRADSERPLEEIVRLSGPLEKPGLRP